MSEKAELLALLEKAKHHKLTPREIWDQRVSWTYGQLPRGNNLIKQQVEQIAAQIYGPRP